MNRIRELRKEYGMSQRELAEILHVTQQAIQQYENNKNYPSTETLIAMSTFFHTSVDYLIGNTDIRTSYDSFNLATPNMSTKDQRLLTIFHQLPKTKQDALLALLES